MVNAGLAPGITNLLAADLLAERPEADAVEMVFTIAVNSTAGPAAGDFAHRGLTGVAHHRTVAVPLPPPFGTRRCLGFAERDEGWLAPAGRTVDTYVCFGERAAHRGMLALNAARVLSRLPRAVLGPGRSVTPEGPSSEPVAHWVAVRRDGRRVAARTLEGRGDFRMAAESAVMFADAVLGRDGAAPAAAGVWYPEELVTLDRLAAPLRRAGVRLVDQPVAASSPGRTDPPGRRPPLGGTDDVSSPASGRTGRHPATSAGRACQRVSTSRAVEPDHPGKEHCQK